MITSEAAFTADRIPKGKTLIMNMNSGTRRAVRRLLLLGMLVFAVAAIAGCGDDDKTTDATPAPGATTETAGAEIINVGMDEFAFELDSDTAAAGDVKFVGTNNGKVMHEMVVLKTDTPAGDLPLEDGEVSEDDAVGEIADLDAGKSKTETIKLEAGHYALICNLPGHFKGGMYADLTVK